MQGKCYVSLPTLGAWIEIYNALTLSYILLSLPTLGAWIEIKKLLNRWGFFGVAPYIGSVD